jgi:hypothetical protein
MLYVRRLRTRTRWEEWADGNTSNVAPLTATLALQRRVRADPGLSAPRRHRYQPAPACPPCAPPSSSRSLGISLAFTAGATTNSNRWRKPRGGQVSVDYGRHLQCLCDSRRRLVDVLGPHQNQDPTPLPPTGRYKSLACGDDFCCAVDLVGTMRCWGLPLETRPSTAGVSHGRRRPEVRLCALYG